MYCCIECFNDEQTVIRGFIQEYGQVISECPFCGTTDVTGIEASQLEDYFSRLFELYEPAEHSVHYGLDEDVIDVGEMLCDLMDAEFSIFSDAVIDNRTSLLNSIFEDNEVYKPHSDGLWIDKFNSYFKVDMLGDSWSTFSRYLKEERRFIFDYSDDKYFNTVLGNPVRWLPSLLKTVEAEIVVTDRFYRGRSGTQKLSEMGAPPRELATPGRANPRGIPFLYLATDRDTVVAELRPWKGEVLSVASGRMRQVLSVVDLSEVRSIKDPFSYSETINLYAERDKLHFLAQLSRELSLPIDRTRADIDYLPTQYLSELIRHRGYEGIFYPSAMNSTGGKNLVIFDPSHFELQSVDYVMVSDIRYIYEEFKKR